MDYLGKKSVSVRNLGALLAVVTCFLLHSQVPALADEEKPKEKSGAVGIAGSAGGGVGGVIGGAGGAVHADP